MKKSILCFLAFFIFHTVSGMYPIARNFSKKTYDAGTQNWMMVQNPGGCIYAANNSGVLEFDGNKWELYRIPGNTTVRSLYYDTDQDVLYAGSFEQFGYFGFDRSGELVYTSVSDSISTNGIGDIWNIYRAGNSMYFQGDNGILREEAGRYSRHTVRSRINSSASIGKTIFISTFTDGALVLTGDIFMPLPQTDLLKEKHVCAILEHGENILFVTSNHGLYYYDGVRIRPYQLPSQALWPSGRIYCAAISGNKLALGTVAEGIRVIDLADGNTISLDNKSGLQNNTVLSLCFDRDDNLWLGLDNGIDYVMINYPEFSLFKSENLYGSGYASLLHGRNLYLGTNQGLFLCDFLREGKTISVSDARVVPELQGQTWKLVRIDDQIFCCHDRGLFIVDGMKATRIEGVTGGAWNIIKLHDREDTAFGCSYNGLFILRKVGGRWEFSHYIEGFDEVSHTFVQASDGYIWFSHWVKGLFHLTLNRDATRIHAEYYGTEKGLPTERNNVPFRYDGGVVFTSEGGFYRYEHARNRMVPHEKINELFAETPVAIRLWESPYNELLLMSDRFFGVAFQDGPGSYTMDSVSLNTMSKKLIPGFEDILFIDENHYLISTENGFSVIDPSKVYSEFTGRRSGSLFIKNVYLTSDGDSLLAGSRGALPPAPIRPLRSNMNSLRFEFASPEFRNEELVRYSYRLEGFDKNWSDFSTTNTKEYTGLKHGRYTLMVRADNPFGSDYMTVEYPFEIMPPWYLTVWAYISYALVATGLIWGLLIFAGRKWQARVWEVEQVKEKEIKEQKKRYEADAREKEKEIVLLRNQTLEYDLKIKSQDLASSTLNLIRKNEILLKIRDDLNTIFPSISKRQEPSKIIRELMKINREIQENIEHDNDWKKFEHNFDMVYEDYLRRLSEQYPQLNMNDKKLCAFLRMDLQSKDMAPLMNISVRSVEMARYRLRRKMGLDRDVNLSEYLQNF